MRSPAPPWRISFAAMLLAVAGCSHISQEAEPKSKPPVPPKTPPPVSTPAVHPPALPLPPVLAAPTKPVLSAGPWTECPDAEATIAVVVTVKTNAVFRERTIVHFLKPAQSTFLRLVRRTASTPVMLEQREIPQACSSNIWLENDEPVYTGINYTVRSTLKQTPVDPSHAVTVDVSVHWERENDLERFEQAQVMTGLSHAELGDGRVAVSVEVLSPQEALARLTPPEKPKPDDTGRCLALLKARYPDLSLLDENGFLRESLPARYALNPTGLGGENIFLYPDHTYLVTNWADISPEAIVDSGKWTLSNGMLSLASPSAAGASSTGPADRYYLVVTAKAFESEPPATMLVGTNRALAAALSERVGQLPSIHPRPLRIFAFVRQSQEKTLAPTASQERLDLLSGDFSDWDQLQRRFHLAFRNGARDHGNFVLAGEAAIEFADVRFSTERIEIKRDQTEMNLAGPVTIDWAGKHFTAGNMIVRVTPFQIQAEAESILEP